jgi:hypothetical protein
MKYIAITILLLLSNPGISCECKEIKNLAEAQRQEFQRSDLVFIAEVISSDPKKGEYGLKILELFKGDKNHNILTGKSLGSCSLFPRKEDGLWLAYATLLPDGSIYITDCGLSRSLRFPYTNSDESPVPPPPRPTKDGMMDELNGLIIESEYRNRALQVLKEEIEMLRKMN